MPLSFKLKDRVTVTKHTTTFPEFNGLTGVVIAIDPPSIANASGTKVAHWLTISSEYKLEIVRIPMLYLKKEYEERLNDPKRTPQQDKIMRGISFEVVQPPPKRKLMEGEKPPPSTATYQVESSNPSVTVEFPTLGNRRLTLPASHLTKA